MKIKNDWFSHSCKIGFRDSLVQNIFIGKDFANKEIISSKSFARYFA